jgi:hypothetical protein
VTNTAPHPGLSTACLAWHAGSLGVEPEQSGSAKPALAPPHAGSGKQIDPSNAAPALDPGGMCQET